MWYEMAILAGMRSYTLTDAARMRFEKLVFSLPSYILGGAKGVKSMGLIDTTLDGGAIAG